MKNAISLALLVLTLFILTGIQQAYAHVLQADSDIGAILHVYPDDNPIAGRQVEYIVSFQDVSKRFSIPKCDCSVTYKLNGTVVDTYPLAVSSELDSKNTYTFSEPGLYTLEFQGKPVDENVFQSFSLTFTKRVSTGDIDTQGMPLLLLVGIAGSVSLLLLAAFVSESRIGTADRKQR